MERHAKGQIVESIIDAAIECILALGLDHVQITQIAAGAGISTRTLHRYYPEKEALLSDAASKYLWYAYTSFADHYEKADKTNMTGLQRLLLLLQSQRNYYRTDTIGAMMFVDMRMYHLRHGQTRHACAVAGAERVRNIVIDNLEACKADGSIRKDIDSSRTSAMISSSYNGVMQRMTLIYRSDMPEEKKSEAVLMFDDYMEMLTAYLSA